MGLRERADVEAAFDRLAPEFSCDPVAEPTRARAIVTDVVSRSGRSHRQEIDALGAALDAAASGTEIHRAVAARLGPGADPGLASWAAELLGPGLADEGGRRAPPVPLLVGLAVLVLAIAAVVLASRPDDVVDAVDADGTTTTTEPTTTEPNPPEEVVPVAPEVDPIVFRSDTVPEGLVDVRREWIVDGTDVTYVVALVANDDAAFIIQHRETLPVELSSDLRPDTEQFTPAGDTMSFPLELAEGESTTITFTGTTTSTSPEEVAAALDAWQERRETNRRALNPDDPFVEVAVTRAEPEP